MAQDSSSRADTKSHPSSLFNYDYILIKITFCNLVVYTSRLVSNLELSLSENGVLTNALQYNILGVWGELTAMAHFLHSVGRLPTPIPPWPQDNRDRWQPCLPGEIILLRHRRRRRRRQCHTHVIWHLWLGEDGYKRPGPRTRSSSEDRRR